MIGKAKADVEVSRKWRLESLVVSGLLLLLAFDMSICDIAHRNVLAAEEEVRVFEPSEDAYVSQLNSNSNYGRDEVISIRSHKTAKESLNHRIYLKFDLKDFDQELYVTSATLYLYKYIEGNNAGARNIEVKRILEQWSELSITWSNKPDYAEKILNRVSVDGAGYWYEWDVSVDVRAWINEGVHNYGFCLKDLEENSRVDYASVFFSREAAEMLLYRPKLEVRLEQKKSYLLPLTPYAFPVGVAVIGCIALVVVAKFLRKPGMLESSLDSTRCFFSFPSAFYRPETVVM